MSKLNKIVRLEKTREYLPLPCIIYKAIISTNFHTQDVLLDQEKSTLAAFDI